MNVSIWINIFLLKTPYYPTHEDVKSYMASVHHKASLTVWRGGGWHVLEVI